MTHPQSPISPQTRTINVRVPIGIFDQLDTLAKATSRTKSFVAIEALSSYLNAQAWQIQEVTQALAEADRGEFATDEEVNATFAKYGA